MKYYYLVASLPLLVLGDEPPFTMDRFLFSCSTVLEPEDQDELQRIAQGKDEACTSAFMQAWRRAECELRNAVATVRARQRNVEARPYLRPQEGALVWVGKAVADAYAKPDPAERELALDRLRWQILDELAAQDPFGLGPVLAFALKLRMAWRWRKLDGEKGRQLVAQFVEQQAGAGTASVLSGAPVEGGEVT